MNLLEWRAAQKLDQIKAGEVLGIPQSSVSRIENGEQFPSPERAAQIVERSGGEITLEDLSSAYLAQRKASAA